MTALNVITQPDAAYILTDTAAIDPDGRVVAFASKVFVSERARLALAFTGWTPETRFNERHTRCAAFVNSMGDPAVALERIAQFASELWRQNADEMEIGSPMHLSLVVAFWSEERGQPEAWLIQTDSLSKGHTPKPVRLCQYVAADPLTGLIPGLADGLALADVSDPCRFDPMRDCLPLIEAQRRLPDAEREGEFNIGGQAELYQIDRRGVTRTVLARWSDRIGQKIRPDGGQSRKRWSARYAA